jgi:formylglycine-generating enzyme required for sulfatase activity/CHAT domain-containing protein
MADSLAALRALRDATTDPAQRAALERAIALFEHEAAAARQIDAEGSAQIGVANQGNVAGSLNAPMATSPGSSAYSAHTIHQHYYSRQTATSAQASSLVRVFDLHVVPQDDIYAVRASAAWAVGEIAAQPFRLPLDAASLNAQRRDAAEWISRVRIVTRRHGEELRKARELGQVLFQELFAGELLAAFRASRSRLAAGEHLRLRLRLPPLLTTLPWELLYDAQEHTFLALDPAISLVRYLELPQPTHPLRVEGPLQVLVVAASPQDDDYPRLAIERELNRITRALHKPREAGQLSLEVIKGQDTRGQLRERMRSSPQRPVHVLHVISHGDWDAVRNEGVLIFEDPDGTAEPISATFLANYLKRQDGQTRLVVLNACQTALAASEHAASSLAAALLRAGVPAVVAMQFDMADDAATDLARIFYAALAAGVAVDVALGEARAELQERRSYALDWVVPVLFLRADDGVLFVPTDSSVELTQQKAAPPPVAAPTAQPPAAVEPSATQSTTTPLSAANAIAKLRQDGLIAYFTEDWERAERLLAQVVAVRSDDSEAEEFLTISRRWLSLKESYATALEIRKTEAWEAVRDILNSIDAEEADYPDSEGLRAWVATEQRRANGFQTALEAVGQGEWGEVRTLMQQLLATFPADERAQALLSQAQKRMVFTVQAHLEAESPEKILQYCQNRLEKIASDQVALEGLVKLLTRPAVLGALRVQAGELLAHYGDPRPGVCDLPGDFVVFHSAKFVIGEPQGLLYKNEINDQALKLAPFELARYVVTNAQYQQFIAAGGYNSEAPWWTGGRDWLRREQKHQPAYWDNTYFGITRPNHPVVGINWYEATAFCAWLTQHVNDGYRYRLPSEAEWEFAGRGTTRRPYPWGEAEPDRERANYNTNHGGTTAVGCFAQGMTPEGLHDMTGNVREWTRSEFKNYPYDPTDGREREPYSAKQNFTLRGGSWIDPLHCLRASYRNHSTCEDRYYYVGLRLARHLLL